MRNNVRIKSRIFGSILTAIVLSVLIMLMGCFSPTNNHESAGSIVKIIIYTDFECGACEKLHSEVELELRRLYESTGKASIEIRLLGAISDDSMRAAEAALYAADHDKFLEYQDSLFRNWRENDIEAYSVEELIKLAESLGLDKEAMRRCLDTGSKKPILENNMRMAQADDVHTLPAVIINGIKLEGYRQLETYTTLIDQSLKDQV